MNKNRVRALVLIGFGFLLMWNGVSADSFNQPEMAEVQDAMRKLKRADNLQMSYVYQFDDGGNTMLDETDVWANQLEGSWVCERYETDEDGKRMYLKQYCDGRSIYQFSDWNGEWEFLERSSTVPYLTSLTTIDYGPNDIESVKAEDDGHARVITVKLTQDYLEEEMAENAEELLASYEMFKSGTISDEAVDNLDKDIEQYQNTVLSDMEVIYTVDVHGCISGVTFNAELTRPDLETQENQSIHITIESKVQMYNQDGIANKVDQCQVEI